jgi:hypothetical protein
MVSNRCAKQDDRLDFLGNVWAAFGAFCVDGLDGRSQTARRFRDLVEGMGNDLGGSDRLSEGQRQLIRRAATLSIMSESVEADFIRNLAFDSEAYGVLCDRLGRCLQRLGLERVSRDVTPSLQSYLQAKAKHGE